MVARSLAAQAGRQPRSEVTSVTVPSARTSQRRNAAVVSQKHDFSKTDTVTYQEYGPNVVTTLYVNQPLNLPPHRRAAFDAVREKFLRCQGPPTSGRSRRLRANSASWGQVSQIDADCACCDKHPAD